MDIIDPALLRYSEEHSSPESKSLSAINRETYAKVRMPRMLSGHLQGRVLSMISHMVKPNVILEIGTYTGYSAICLAEGLQKNGKLITIDINEELETIVRQNFQQAGVTEIIDYKIGNALDIIPQLKERFDLVFIDADKENYLKYFNLVFDKVNLNGFILADNVLWKGKVLDDKTDKDTKAIKIFNQEIRDDPRLENVLLPIRDGLMIVRKMSS